MNKKAGLSLKDLIKTRKAKGIILLIILLIALLITVWVSDFTIQPRQVSRVFICPGCGTKFEASTFKEVDAFVCPNCGKMAGYGMKCQDCDLEFSFVRRKIFDEENRSKEEIEEALVEQKRCPNCHSENTYLLCSEEGRKRLKEAAKKKKKK